MMRRLAMPATRVMAPAAAARCYSMGPLTEATRRPQLKPEEIENVKIDQSQWPAVFKDYDPADPYKKVPEWCEGMSTWDYVLMGMECSFVFVFYECVFPERAAL